MTKSAEQLLMALVKEADDLHDRWEVTSVDAWGLVQRAKSLKGRIMTTVAWGSKEPHYSVYVAVAQMTALEAEFDLYIKNKTENKNDVN